MDIGAIEGFIGGVITTLVAVWRFVSSRISPTELQQIKDKLTEAIEHYKKIKEDDKVTEEELLEEAEKIVALIEEILKALKS